MTKNKIATLKAKLAKVETRLVKLRARETDLKDQLKAATKSATA